MRLRALLVRLRAMAGLGGAQLRHAPGRALLAVSGVMLAVLVVTLLAGLGIGVVETGQTKMDESGRDIWITGGPGAEASRTENSVVDAQAVAAEIRIREDVGDVSTIAMHDLYVGATPNDTQRVTTVGIPGTHTHFEFDAGRGFAGAAYESNTSDRELPADANLVVLHPALADRFDLAVGDTVYLGASAQRTHPYIVSGIGSYYGQYLGTPTVTMRLANLQNMTGTAGADRAAFITVNVADDASPQAVHDALQTAYPAYTIRMSDEQFAALVSDRHLVIASGLTLVGLAIVGGIVLTANLFVLVTYQQRDALAALRAIGLSRWLLAGLIGVQGLLIGVLGGLCGLVATPLLAHGLNWISTAVLGFEQIMRPTPAVYALGFGMALLVGTGVALVTGWQASRLASPSRLES